MSWPVVLLAVASTLHAGFQLTVTAVVYPALAEVPDEHWRGAHAAHSRRIVLLVGPVYVVLLAAGVAALVEGPGILTWAALAGAAAAVIATAVAAAPTHARLDGATGGQRQHLLRRLLRADRVRCTAAVLGAAAAVLAAVGVGS